MSLTCPEPNNTLAIFDGDEILYRCGFACQKKIYRIEGVGEFRYAKEYKQALGDLGIDHKNVLVKVDVEIEPVENAYHNINSFLGEHLNELKAEKYIIYLSGLGNFRYYLATIQPYKGNRSNNSKPPHYHEMIDYIMDEHNGVIVDGIEADDAIGIHAYRHFKESEGLSYKLKTIVCSQDKDLKMIPGWNYNTNSRKLTWISEKDAEVNFLVQVLSGDDSDNIPGIKGIGEITARKILQGYKNRDDLYALVYHEYEEYYNGDCIKAEDHLHEVCKLLWILRKPGVTWDGSSI